MPAAKVCSCGRQHEDISALALVGHQSLFNGDVAELRNCTCGSTMCVAILEGASLCRSCGCLVRGCDGDTKVVATYGAGTSGGATSRVYCIRCAATLVGDPSVERSRAFLRIIAAKGQPRKEITR